MIQRIKVYCLSCIVVMCLIFSSCATKKEGTVERLSENNEASPMLMSESGIKSIIEKAKPLIEEISGLYFNEDIKFQLVKRDTYRDLFAQSLLPYYLKMMKGVDKNTVSRQVEMMAQEQSQKTLGLYFPKKKTMFLIPDNAQAQIERYEIKDKDFKDFLFLYVTYRMIAALDDQNFNIMEETGSKDMEASAASRALTEGHAAYITNKIAERLKLSDNIKNIYLKSIAGITDATDPRQQQVFNLRYIKGREFVEAIIKRKGLAGIKEAFASPPVSMRQILNPETYFTPSAKETVDCLELMKKVSQKLPIEGMQSRTVPMNTTILSSAMASRGVSAADANRVTADCINGAVISAAKQAQKPVIITATILNFTDSAAVNKYLALSRKVDESSRAQVNAMLNAKLKIVEEDDNPGLDGFDTAKYMHVEQTVDGKVTESYSAEGVIDNFYFSIGFINPEKEQNEEGILEILKSMNKERLSMM